MRYPRVCVCVGQRARERERAKAKITFYIQFSFGKMRNIATAQVLCHSMCAVHQLICCTVVYQRHRMTMNSMVWMFGSAYQSRLYWITTFTSWMPATTHRRQCACDNRRNWNFRIFSCVKWNERATATSSRSNGMNKMTTTMTTAGQNRVQKLK